MAVKPSERTEMAAVYSTFRDVSGFITPGVAWLVLLAAPVSGVFALAGLATGLSRGAVRESREAAVAGGTRHWRQEQTNRLGPRQL